MSGVVARCTKDAMMPSRPALMMVLTMRGHSSLRHGAAAAAVAASSSPFEQYEPAAGGLEALARLNLAIFGVIRVKSIALQ